ncbi:MAG: hypothetical protein H7339_17075 [Arcicella sp.]|nr:hypothetical protein [Arcicella sp.]
MKKILTYKLKSAALQFAIFIAVLIALLLGSLVLYVYTFVYLKGQSKASIENVQLADSGMNYLLQQSEINSDTTAIPYLESDNQKIKVNLSYWGIFEKAFVKTEHRQKNFIKTAFVGSEINSKTDPTLYLQENYNPLSVVGLTKISGNTYLPSQGIKPGYIAGQSYYGAQMIYGTTKRSGIQLPKIEKKCFDGLLFYSITYKPVNSSLTIYKTKNQIIKNSFKSAPRNYYSSNPILLENTELTGNIIIKSDTIIQIKKSAKLKDIILIAPEILIEDEVTGNFQCIASKSIKVGKACKLSYPTALILIQENKDKPMTTNIKPFENQIFINAGTIIKGSVCYFQTNELTDFKTQLILEKNSRIKGQVYCQGNFELKGTVSGCVFTKQFISNTAGSVFVNHILNGTIENENTPDIYGGIIFEKDKKSILKWLY